MDTIVDNQPQGSSTLLSSLFAPSGSITGGVTNGSPFTSFISPSTTISATAPAVDGNYDKFAPSMTTGLGYSASNSISVSAPQTSEEPSAPSTAGPPAPTAGSPAPKEPIATGLSRGEEAGIAIGAVALIALFVWW